MNYAESQPNHCHEFRANADKLVRLTGRDKKHSWSVNKMQLWYEFYKETDLFALHWSPFLSRGQNLIFLRNFFFFRSLHSTFETRKLMSRTIKATLMHDGSVQTLFPRCVTIVAFLRFSIHREGQAGITAFTLRAPKSDWAHNQRRRVFMTDGKKSKEDRNKIG